MLYTWIAIDHNVSIVKDYRAYTLETIIVGNFLSRTLDCSKLLAETSYITNKVYM